MRKVPERGMTVRSSSLGEFLKRLLFLFLLCLSVHCGVVAIRTDGEGKPFDLTQAGNLRTALVVCAVMGLAGFLLRPGEKTAETVAASPTPELPADPVVPQPAPESAPELVSTLEPEPVVDPEPAVEPEPQPIPGPQPVFKPEPTPLPEPEPVPEPAEVPVRAHMDARLSEPVQTDPLTPEEMWQKARTMKHGYVPDSRKDYGYLSLLSRAALAGHLEAQLKLGEYASRRGAQVETYYWLKRAKLCGAQVRNLDWKLRDCCNQWVWRGCQPEYENVYPFFSERQGVLGRAALRIDSGTDVFQALMRLRGLAAKGDSDAVLFLGKGGPADNASVKPR